MKTKGIYESFFKRALDVSISLMALIILSPLFIIISILVFFKLGYPILFVQHRPGKNDKIFPMYKFRTMTNKTDSKGLLLPDAQRLTRFGKFLRSTSLDELPELWNILKGDMSLVGPRPLLVDYLELYNSEQRKRHDVRPGLTGLAQVNGRNSLEWEEKFKYDCFYVDNISFKLDVKIIFLTFYKVLKKEAINSNQGSTVNKFEGNNAQ